MTTRYIATNGNDDTGDGTTGSPYATLSKAVSVSNNGDTILCKAGTYKVKNTTVNKGVTIGPDTGASVIFKGTDTLAAAAFTKTGGQTNVYQADWADGAGGSIYVWQASGGEMLTSRASLAALDAAAGYYWNANVLYVNVGGSAPGDIEAYATNQSLLVLSAANITLQDVTLQWSMMSVVVTGGTDTIDGCTFRYWANYGGTDFGAVCLKSSSNTVQDCTFNIIYSADASNGGYCVDSYTGGHNNNSVLDCNCTSGGTCITFRSGTGHLVDGCTCNDWSQDAIDFEGASGTVSNCTLKNLNRAVHGIIRNVTSGTVTVHHCIGYTSNNASQYGLITDPGANANWYHNVMHNMVSHYLAQTNGTMDIRNNIAYVGPVGSGAFSAGEYTPTLTFNYNCMYGLTTNYGAGFSAGANDVTSDPLFVATDGTNYNLQSTSPCIDTGILIAGINTTDRGIDIGRFDFATSKIVDAGGVQLLAYGPAAVTNNVPA